MCSNTAEAFSAFFGQVVVGSCGVGASELTCLAHSMGGLLSLMAAAGDRGLFQRLVACSPMLRMKARYSSTVVRDNDVFDVSPLQNPVQCRSILFVYTEVYLLHRLLSAYGIFSRETQGKIVRVIPYNTAESTPR